VLPAYNAEKHIADAIESILGQTYTNFELILLNDGSTDATLNIIYHYLNTDSRIRLVNSEINNGLIYQLNLGVEKARGNIIARMDSDDVADLRRLETQLRFLMKNPNFLVVGSNVNCINIKGEIMGSNDIESSNDNIFWNSFFKCPVSHPTTMFYKSILNQVGGYRSNYFPAEDFDLWTRILRIGEIGILPDKLLYYRVHEDSTSRKQKESQLIKSQQILVEHWDEFLKIPINESEAYFLHGYHRGVELPMNVSPYKVYSNLHRLRELLQKRYGTISLDVTESYFKISLYLFIIGFKRFHWNSFIIFFSLSILFPARMLKTIIEKLL
jgi:glycosyltransferase involved in cell wall biosynthesis